MSTTITKRENTDKFISLGKSAIIAADIVKVSQKDGDTTGFAVGLVCGKLSAEGKAGSRFFSPLAELLKKELGAVAMTAFNEYTRVFKDARKCAECVQSFVDRYNVALGTRASAILATPADDAEGTQVTKRSDAERVCDFVGKLMTRKANALSAVAVADLFSTALAACGGKADRELADAIAKAVEMFAETERLVAETAESASK